MKKFVKYNKLFDCYSELLTDKEQNAFIDYYREDLSLQEIAENNNVSRSAIHKTIKNVEEKLEFYEDKLHLSETIDNLKSVENINNLEDVKKTIKKILNDF